MIHQRKIWYCTDFQNSRDIRNGCRYIKPVLAEQRVKSRRQDYGKVQFQDGYIQQ